MFEQATLILGTGIAIFVAVNAFFFKADDFFSKEFKDDVAKWIKGIKPRNQDGQDNLWSGYFIQLFDSIFSKLSSDSNTSFRWRNYFNLRTFFYSCTASLIAITVITFIGFTIGSLNFETDAFHMGIGFALTAFLFFMLILNLVPDYLSLLQTRYFLKIVEKPESLSRLVLFLIADMFFSIIIFLIVGTIIGPIVYNIIVLQIFNLKITLFLHIISIWRELLWLEKGGGNIYGVYFYSTFFTSVWIWLFGISNIFLSIASRSGPTVKFLKYMLPVEEKPFRSLGIVAGLLATIIYLVFAVINTAVEQVA